MNDINFSEVSVAMINRSQEQKAVLDVDEHAAQNVWHAATNGIMQSGERAPQNGAEGVHSEGQSRTVALSSRAREGGLEKEGRTDTKDGTGEVNQEDSSDRDDDVIRTDGGSDPENAYGVQREAPYSGFEDKTRGVGHVRQAAAALSAIDSGRTRAADGMAMRDNYGQTIGNYSETETVGPVEVYRYGRCGS